jgi:nucleoside-diphosphate-sugar epimerase
MKITTDLPKILITGGNGNIAKIIKKLDNYQITAPARHDLNILDLHAIDTYLNAHEFDILVHTAVSGGRRTKEEIMETTHINLLMFENLMKFSDKFKMIIHFDSAAIYDRNTDILNRKEEDLFTIPIDHYGFSKYVIYQRSMAYINVFHLRLFNIFHANEEHDRFISSCFFAKKNNKKLTIFEDKFFDFFYDDDFLKVVDYYFQNMNKISLLQKTVNICYNEKYRLSDIAKKIIGDPNQILIIKSTSSNNYSGNGDKLNSLPILFDGLDASLRKYEEIFIISSDKMTQK